MYLVPVMVMDVFMVGCIKLVYYGYFNGFSKDKLLIIECPTLIPLINISINAVIWKYLKEELFWSLNIAKSSTSSYVSRNRTYSAFLMLTCYSTCYVGHVESR